MMDWMMEMIVMMEHTQHFKSGFISLLFCGVLPVSFLLVLRAVYVLMKTLMKSECKSVESQVTAVMHVFCFWFCCSMWKAIRQDRWDETLGMINVFISKYQWYYVFSIKIYQVNTYLIKHSSVFRSQDNRNIVLMKSE